jgi:hypothetical protein
MDLYELAVLAPVFLILAYLIYLDCFKKDEDEEKAKRED